MSGTQSNDYALEYIARARTRQRTEHKDVANDMRNQTGGIEAEDVRWAEYGYPQRARGNIVGGGRTGHRTPVWAIVCEDEFDERTLSRLWTSREGERFTVLYRPDDQRITRSCGGEDGSHDG